MDCKLIILLALFSTLVAQCSSGIPFRQKRVRLCGTRLVEAMSVVCNRHYNSPKNKKSVNFNQDILEDSSFPEYSEDYSENALSAPSFFDRLFDSSSNLFIPMRHQRGIVDECCTKPCSREVLMSYCS